MTTDHTLRLSEAEQQKLMRMVEQPMTSGPQLIAFIESILAAHVHPALDAVEAVAGVPVAELEALAVLAEAEPNGDTVVRLVPPFSVTYRPDNYVSQTVLRALTARALGRGGEG